MDRLLHDIDSAVDRIGCWELYADIARIFAETLPETLSAIVKAIDTRAWDDARRLVHSLKGNCSTIGAEELRNRVYDLEKACSKKDDALVAKLFPLLREDLLRLHTELLELL